MTTFNHKGKLINFPHFRYTLTLGKFLMGSLPQFPHYEIEIMFPYFFTQNCQKDE